MSNNMKKPGHKGDILLRLIKTLFGFYPVLLPVVVVCILFNAIVSSIPSIFMQNVISKPFFCLTMINITIFYHVFYILFVFTPTLFAFCTNRY